MTVEYVLASAIAIVLFVLAANVVVDLYVGAAVRDALDDGVRAGIPIGAGVPSCTRRATAAVDGLVHGAFRSGIRIQCAIHGTVVTADARIRFVSFVPGVVPAWTTSLRRSAPRELP